MDCPLAPGRRVIVRPRSKGLTRHYTDHIGYIIKAPDAEGDYYVVQMSEDLPGDDPIRLVLTPEEVDPV